MATSTYGTPYVQGSDLVSAYPTVSSSLATRVDEVSYARNGLNAQTGTTYTLVVGDAGKTITLSNASPVAVTLPQDSTADLPDGAVVTFYNLGAGTVTISQGTGATLQGGSITLAQYEVTTVIKLSANTYGRFDGAPAPGLSAATPTSIANSGGTATLSGNTVTFTTVNSVSLNGCFTGDYDNYRVFLRSIGSTNVDVILRLRTSGSDATGSDYTRQTLYAFSTTVGADTSTGTSITISTGNTTSGLATIEVSRPQVATPTFFTSFGGRSESLKVFTGLHGLSTSYDGMTIFPNTGTISGTVSVYGYKK